MGVYSGVYEYTQQIQEQIRSIQSIQVFVHLLSCRQDPCSIMYRCTVRTGNVHGEPLVVRPVLVQLLDVELVHVGLALAGVILLAKYRQHCWVVALS